MPSLWRMCPKLELMVIFNKDLSLTATQICWMQRAKDGDKLDDCENNEEHLDPYWIECIITDTTFRVKLVRRVN